MKNTYETAFFLKNPCASAVVMTLVAKKSKKKQQINNPQTHLLALLSEWGNGLKDNTFMGKKKPNGADLTAFGILHSIKDLPAFQLVKETPRVYRWFTDVEAALGKTNNLNG